tara:strand:+ start:800 stop:1054 length:255 start_codon:yes stop_codon:yes gene_type:complete
VGRVAVGELVRTQLEVLVVQVVGVLAETVMDQGREVAEQTALAAAVAEWEQQARELTLVKRAVTEEMVLLLYLTQQMDSYPSTI